MVANEEKDEIGRFVACNLADTTLITKADEITVKRRQGRVLLIAPPVAGWIVLEPDEFSFWSLLQRSQSWEQVRSLEHKLSQEERAKLMERLYQAGLLNWNGRSYFNVQTMWERPQTYPSFLCLHITEACNFGCKYCFADSVPTNGYMPVETAERIIAKCLRELPPEKLLFDFHGGEPLMAWDLLVHCVQYARELNEKENIGKDVSFIFQTNGSLLTSEKVKKHKELDVDVGISLDGPAEVHDKNRIFARGTGQGKERGTFEVVVANWKNALSLGLRCGVLGVVHDPADYIKCFNFFVNELGLRRFRLNYSSFIGRSTRLLDFSATRAEDFANHWLEMVDVALEWCREHQETLTISDVDVQINNLMSRNRPFMCYRAPCGVCNSILGFAIDGGVHACEEMASSGVLRLGNVFDEGFNLKDMVDNNELCRQLQRRTPENIPRCKRCGFRRFCSAGCTSKTLAYYGEYMHESPMCRFYKRVFEGLMWRIYENPDLVPWLGTRFLGKHTNCVCGTR